MMEEEFNRLYARYHDMLYYVALSRVHYESDVQDILQNIFLSLYLHHPAFTDERHERKWLLRVCVNACIDYHKSYWNQHTSHLDETQSMQSTVSSMPLLNYASLSAVDHRILTLYYYQGYRIQDIAAMQHMSIANVKVRKKKALLSLQQQLTV